jgi:hypothetical protein
MKSGELTGELGPLPPMKIHCAELVEGALRSALAPSAAPPAPANAEASAGLLESFTQPKERRVKVVFLDPQDPGPKN